MQNDKCKILWDFTIQMDHEIYGKRPEVIVVRKDKNLCQIIDFALWKSGKIEHWKKLERIRKNRTLRRFGMRADKDMEHKSQGYTISDENNTHKVKKLVKGNRY